MPVFGSLGLEGLTANDRSQSDKIAIAQQGGSNLMVTPPNFDMSPNRRYFHEISDTNAILQNTYQDMLQKYKDQFHIDRDTHRVGYGFMNIKDIAARVSPWFKKYGYSDYIDLSDLDWSELAASYQAATEAYKDNGATANAMLDNAIKNNVAKNQPWYEQAWCGLAGVGVAAAGAAIGFAGAVKGAVDYFDGAYKDIEGLTGWQNFMNSVIDNDWSRYGNDVVQYGAYFKDHIEEAKELGISNLQIVETDDQENSLISTASPWIALQSGGFTLASMFLGLGEAKAASLLFKGLGITAKAVKTGEALTATLANLQKAQNVTNKFILPGLVGTMEGLSEGLNTKQQAEQDGFQAVQEMQQQEINAEVNKRLQNYNQVIVKGFNGSNQVVKYKDKKTGQLFDINQIYQQVWNEYAPKYEESLKQVEYASAKAGINNFYVNSLINGMLNSTLKAGLQAPSVRNALSKTKLFGWAQPKSNFDITGSGSTTTVTSKFGAGKTAWNIIKEPLGEFGEEYMQSVSDATMRGGAENNIHEFIDNKYKGDGSAAVGDNFSSDWNASWTALTGSSTDHETIKSGIYGAISSVMGTPSLGHKARTGRVDANGKAETTYFGRGLNEKGERETQLERLGRILPWRNGITQAYRESRIEQHRAEEAAQVLQDWLRDPNNKDKFDGLVGTYNWAKAMGDAGLGSDEFGYRNSALGKTINDAFMLQKLQGTKYYDAYLNQLIEVANLEEGSELAEKYISEMRDNVNTSDENQSDSDILKTLKSNANKMLSTLDNIKKESDRVDNLVGNVDEDTKQSLIYGQMMLKDWHEREQKLKDELANIHIDNSVEHSSSLTDKQKQVLADYNSIEEAKKQQAELEKKLATIKDDIKNLKSRSNLADTEKRVLRDKKATAKSIEKELKRLEVINDVEEGTSEVLSEQEIMNLDPISRAIMLRKGKQKTYVATHGGREELTRRVNELNSRIDDLNSQRAKYIKDNGRVKKGHNKQVKRIDADITKAQKELDAVKAEEKPYYSAEQQAVIDNLFNQGTAQDEKFLDKMVDAGRIRNSIESFNAQYQAILSDPHSFNNYVFNARQSAADIASKRKFQAMNNIQNYADFAREMDKMYRESSGREQMLITNAFRDKNNANFERYTNERQMLQDLIEQVTDSEQHKNMSTNDKEMFAHTITYLSNKGVDFNNNQAVVEALAATDENGVSEFKKYVEEANAALPEAEQTAFTSIGEAIQNFNDVMVNYNKDVAQRKANAAPIEVTPTSEGSATPAVNPEPVHQEGATQSSGKSIFDIAGSSTPEGGFIDSSGQVIDTSNGNSSTGSGNNNGGNTETQSNNDSSSADGTNQIIEEFKTNSNDEVASTAEVALNVARNQPHIDASIKSNTVSFIESLSKNSFANTQEFVEALLQSATARELNSENGTTGEAELLRQVAAKVQANEASKRKATEGNKSMSPLLDKKRQELNRTNQMISGTYNMFPNSSSGSSFIASINIDSIRQRFPNSSIVKYYDKYRIEDALRNGILDNKPDIFFITDEELTKAVSQDMGSSYNATKSLPIVAVVKTKNGPIKIGNESYQPISIMASTDKEESAGSTHMAPIRNAALSNQGTDLISINNKPIVTKPYGFPKAYPVDRNYRGRNNVIEVGIGDLTQGERTSLESQSKTQRRRNPAYKRAKSNFLSNLGTKMIGGRKALVFNQPTLNGKFNAIEIFVSPINESTARNSDLSFEDAAREGNVSDFNSRTSRTTKALKGFFSSFTQEDLIFEEKDGQIIPTPQTAEALRTMADNLQKKINDFINIPVKDGWEYRITPRNETDGDSRIMDLSIINTNTNEVIQLTTFNQGMTEEDIKQASEDFLKNLILDDNGAVRMVGQDSFAKWNVLYSDVEKMSENGSAANNISDIYEDGILGAAATTFNYRIQGIAVQNPFNKEGNPVITETANADNAAPSQPTTTPAIAEGQVRSGSAIVTDDGVVLEGTPEAQKNQALERAKTITNQIENDSKGIKLSDDGSAYVDSNGKRYAGVTSVISADEKSDGRFDPNNPRITPSTNIDVGFGKFVRDFFAGKLDSMTEEQLAENYPNATKEALRKFREQLVGLRNNFIANGLTIVPRDVIVTGSLDVLDSNGNIHTVDVADTLDLLAYDGNGNFFIFGMKTNRNGMDQHEQEKYSRQLSLDKKFLESKYGIQVKSLNLIPIGVEYPAPVGHKNGTADYSVSPEKANQLLIDGKQFTGANPTLQTTIAVPYTEPHIVWEKMTDEEKAMFGGVEDAVATQSDSSATPTEAVPSKPIEPSIDPTLGVAFEDEADSLADMFGLDASDMGNFNMDFSQRTTAIPSEFQWNNLTQEQRDGLEMKGFNETSWSSMEDEEMKQELGCL